MRHPLWDRIADDADQPLSDDQHALLHRYLDGLIEANERMNLTRIVDRADAEVKHIADALTVLRFMPARSTRTVRIADVGTGGGVPGVPIAIARPDLRVTLIDATRKKLDAVMAIVREIGLTNVDALHARLEPKGPKVLGYITNEDGPHGSPKHPTYQIVVARAVGELGKLVEWVTPILSQHGTLLAMKGPKAAEELQSARRSLGHVRLRATLVDLNVPELPGHVVVKATRM